MGQKEAWVYNANAIFSLLLVQLFGEQHNSSVGYFSNNDYAYLWAKMQIG